MIGFLEALGSRWAALVWPVLWQGSMVSLVVLACLPLVRRVSPALGLALVSVALLKFFIPPVVLAPMASLNQAAKSLRPDSPLADYSLAASVLLMVHVVGIVLAGWQLRGRRRELAGLVASGTPVCDEEARGAANDRARVGSQAVATAHESAAVTAPLAVGVGTPTILLPSALRDSLTAEQIRVVIAHELVHHQ